MADFDKFFESFVGTHLPWGCIVAEILSWPGTVVYSLGRLSWIDAFLS